MLDDILVFDMDNIEKSVTNLGLTWDWHWQIRQKTWKQERTRGGGGGGGGEGGKEGRRDRLLSNLHLEMAPITQTKQGN